MAIATKDVRAKRGALEWLPQRGFPSTRSPSWSPKEKDVIPSEVEESLYFARTAQSPSSKPESYLESIS